MGRVLLFLFFSYPYHSSFCLFLFCHTVSLHYLCIMNDYERLWRPLTGIYEAGEAKAIIRYVLEVKYGITSTDLCCG